MLHPSRSSTTYEPLRCLARQAKKGRTYHAAHVGGNLILHLHAGQGLVPGVLCRASLNTGQPGFWVSVCCTVADAVTPWLVILSVITSLE